MNYKKSYYYLFNQITEEIERLKELQKQAEEICIAQGEEPDENSKIKFTQNKKER